MSDFGFTLKPRRHPVTNNWVRPTIEFDDSCNNGHRTLSITAEVLNGRLKVCPASPRGDAMLSCGQCHDDIVAAFPELEPFIKWHLVSEDGPLHYIANGTYHLLKALGLFQCFVHDEFEDAEPEPALTYFQKTVVWGASPSWDSDVMWADLISEPCIQGGFADDKARKTAKENVVRERVRVWGNMRLPRLLTIFGIERRQLHALCKELS